jgi:hypothetical protein
LLLGVAPSVHPSLGAWLWLIAGISAAFDLTEARAILRTSWKYFAAGCLVTALSLAAHLVLAYHPPSIAPDQAARYLGTFTALWDGHRQPVPLTNPGVLLNVGMLALALIWLIPFRGDLPRPALFLLRFAAVSAAVGLACVLISWVPPDRLPAPLVILMPARILNVGAMTFAALLLGLAGAYARQTWGAAILLMLTVALLLAPASMLRVWADRKGLAVPGVAVDQVAVMLTAGAALVLGRLGTRWRWRRTGSTAGIEPGPSMAVAGAMMAVVVIVVALGAWPLPPRHSTVFLDRTNDGVLAVAARKDGLLLTGGDLHMVQLRTRRPILLDGGGLDALPYAIESAPAMDRILRDVYGVDLFNPPAEALNSGTVPPGANRAAWERYSPERWSEIRRDYRVTQVLTQAGWELKLPIVAQSMRFLLYEIPE